jgi:glycosyltransferase involved in cell wall biosynthesis
VSFHGADLTVYPRLPWWELPRRVGGGRHRYQAVFPHVAAAVVPSPVVEAQLRAIGYRGPLEVLPSGVRLDEFPLRAGPPAGPPRLLFVGRLVQRKGLDVLLRGLSELRDDLANARLEVCGDGPERRSSEALARRLGLVERVRFLGARPRREVRQLIRDSHLLVLPSRTMPDGEIETLGVVLLEAMATGVPVVATDSGGIPAAFPPGRRNELVPEGDPEALATRILAVLSEADPAERIREGREWVEREYSWERLAPRMEALYERTLGGSDCLAQSPAAHPLERDRGDVGKHGGRQAGDSP